MNQKILDYENTIKPLHKRAVTFLVNDEKVLLGLKKEGLGEGKLIGIGGKQEEHESIEETAERELFEEIFVNPKELILKAEIDFYFPYAENPGKYNQKMFVFTCNKWKGIPVESPEIEPIWIDISNIPYEKMWDDYKLWFERILKGENTRAKFMYDKEKLIEWDV